MRTKLLFICLLLTISAFSQQHAIFTNITRSSGLPVDEISSLAQDSSGFIWAGSAEGLFRYDGFTFKSFSFNESKTHIGTSITKIIVDSRGHLWITSIDGGICCISNSGRILKVINSFTHAMVTEGGNYATDVKEDHDGNIWWTTTDGIYRLDREGKLVCFRLNTNRARGNSFSQLYFDEKGTAWFCGFLGLRSYDPPTHSLVPAGATDAERTFFASRKDFSAIMVHDNKVWFSNWIPEMGNFVRSSGNSEIWYSGKGSPLPDFNRMANIFFRDSKGAVWIGTGSGLYWIRPGERQPQAFLHDPQNDYSLAGNWINGILEDREGNFWIATKKGISVIRPYTPSLVNISEKNRAGFTYAGKIINDIFYVDDDRFLIGTNNADGLYLTDGQFRTRQHWNFHNVKYDWIWHFFDDRKRQRVLISTQEGMLVFNKRTNKVSNVEDTVLQHFYPITSFVATSDSIVWMSRYWNKLLRYNLETGASRIIDITRLGEKPQILFLSRDNDNRLWIRSHGSGLWRFDETTGQIVERIGFSKGENSIRELSIYFLMDLGTHYLLGYNSHGLSLYNKTTKTFRHLTKEDGLISNNIHDAVRAKDGMVWIATGNGISRYDPATGKIRNYGNEKGILQSDFQCIRELPDGRIVAGSTTGLVCFLPGELNKKQALAPPILTDFSIYGKSQLQQSTAAQPAAITVGYGDNYFSFEYISLHYNSPQQVEYAYKLEGLDQDWILAGSRRFVSYSRVPGGHYTFRVKARLPNDEWVESAMPLQLFVKTAFYKQWWFYILCILLIAAFFYGLFHYRLQQVLRMERMRTAISSDLHDEVGASLTSISLFSEMARQANMPQVKKEEYLQRIGERSRESIERMSDIIWSINPENDGLEEMLLRMKKYASEHAEGKNIELQWNLDGNFSVLKLSMEKRKDFYLFFKEAINNAVKHGEAKQIRVSLSVRYQQITLNIYDDGKGFDMAGSNNGNGLTNMQRRAGRLQGSMKITRRNGTLVELVFSA